MNKSAGKWSSFGSYQYTKSNNFERLSSDRFIALDSSSVLQNSYTEYPGGNHYLGGGTDYQFNKKLNVSYDGSFSLNNSKSDAENTNLLLKKSTGNILGNNQSLIENNNRSIYFSNALSGKYKIDSLGSELTSELSYNIFNADNAQDYFNTSTSNPAIGTNGDGTQRNDKYIFAFRSDLTYKFKNKITLEAGIKYSNSSSNNNSNYFIQRPGEQRKVDSFQTNRFRYAEQISATYLQLARTIFGFTLKPGLRLETTDITGRQQVPTDTSFSIRRTDLFPYAYLSHNLFKIFGNDLIANAIYRRSITRPYYENLNPYLKYVDQYLFETGNPNLKPQFTTKYEFNVSYDNFPVFSIGVNDTKDIFSNVTYQDQVTKIAYRTYDNLGKNKEFYFRAVGGIPPGGKYFFYAGGRYNKNTYEGFYQNRPLNYTYDGWVFFMYQEYKFSRSLNVNMQGFMRTRGLQNFYEIGSFGGLYFSLNKNVLNNKGTISLSVRDALYTNPVDFSLDQNGIQATGHRENDSRRVGLKFRYNFGLQKKKEKAGFTAPSVEGTNQ